jgi:hypothetical protein
MGSGLSAHQAVSPSASSKGKATSTLARQPAPSLSSKSVGSKHVDLCEIKSLDVAKAEIQRLREELDKANNGASEDTKVVIGAKKLEARLAVVAAPIDAKNDVRKTVVKNHQVKKLIFDTIKHNILFRSCSDEELVDLVDAFSPKDYS